MKKSNKKIQKKVAPQKKTNAKKTKTTVKKAPSKIKAKTSKVIKKPAKKPAKKPTKKLEKKIVKKTIKKLVKKPTKTKATFGPVDVLPYSINKNEHYMNKKQLTHFHDILSQWKNDLMEDVDRTMLHMQDKASNYPDPVDRASQEEEFSLELRTRDRERKLLKKIEETLLRINDNDYGYCDDCGAEVGLRRLEARPTATQCIECKTIAEIRERQLGESG
jgi:DnaK suppressor protein